METFIVSSQSLIVTDLCYDGFVEIEIGYNHQKEVCGVREQCVINYFCNRCNNDIFDLRYHCRICDDFDLCESCFNGGQHDHDQSHALIAININDEDSED